MLCAAMKKYVCACMNTKINVINQFNELYNRHDCRQFKIDDDI